MSELSAVALLASAMTRVTFPRTGYAPYFGAVLRGLLRREMPQEMVEAMGPSRATIAVSRDAVLYYYPPYIKSKSVEELAFYLMHEAKHVLLDHFRRTDKLAPPPEHLSLCNIAQDMCINEGLREVPALSGLGKDGVYPETYGQPPKLIWEERYRLLLQNSTTVKISGVGKGGCGSCSGVPLPGEPKPSGNNKDGGGRSDAAIDRIRRETAEAIKAYKQAKGIGSVPSDLDVWADSILTPPKVDWRTKLGTIIRGAIATRPGSTMSTYLRPSRRQAGIGYGVGRPVMIGSCAPTPRIATVIDTSGSMFGAPLKAAASELAGILSAAGADVTVCTVDAAVHGLQEVKTIDQALRMMKGGGGTDMGVGIKALAERRPQPEICIVLTDGYIPHPGDEPPFRVVWCVVRDNPDNVYQAPWGEVVMVDERDPGVV